MLEGPFVLSQRDFSWVVDFLYLQSSGLRGGRNPREEEFKHEEQEQRQEEEQEQELKGGSPAERHRIPAPPDLRR